MENPIIAQIVSTSIGLIVGLIFSTGVSLINKSKERETIERSDIDLLKSSICSFLRNELKKECEKHLQVGYCDTNTKETLTDMYNNYHKLGGNSFITDIYNKVMALPCYKEREVR